MKRKLFTIGLALLLGLSILFATQSWAVGTWTYDESLNTIVVTQGTSGTPATFSDFVTADRAGTAELTPEDAPAACTTNMTLTYQIRPVEKLALQTTFTLAGTSAGAGDTLDVTGTDWDGNAQNESIDVSAGDGAYTGAYKWRTITDIDCTGWADGTLKVTQPQWGVIWDYGNGQYRIEAHFHIGGGGTSTYFDSSKEMVVHAEDMEPETYANASLSITNSYWYIDGVTWTSLCFGGTVNITRSVINIGASWLSFYSGTANLDRVTFCGAGSLYFRSYLTTLNINDVYVIGINYLILQITPTTMSGFTIDNLINYMGIEASCAATGLNIKNMAAWNTLDPIPGVTFTDIDPVWAVNMNMVRTDAPTRVYKEVYTCNIHVANKSGTNLAGVTVDCEDQYGTACWAAGTITTDANGDITEQQIEYRTEVNQVTTTYSPHKFTISKAGYETLILENITVDAPIVWHLELQSIKHPPAPWDF